MYCNINIFNDALLFALFYDKIGKENEKKDPHLRVHSNGHVGERDLVPGRFRKSLDLIGVVASRIYVLRLKYLSQSRRVRKVN